MIGGYDHRSYRRGAPGFRDSEKSRCMYSLVHFGVSSIEISCLANTRKTDLWRSRVPKRRNTKTMCASPFRDFAYRDFTICEDRRISHPGLPEAETPKHHNLSMLYHFGMSQVGISGVVRTKDLPPDIPGAEAPEH
jgi:hypothetical protein